MKLARATKNLGVNLWSLADCPDSQRFSSEMPPVQKIFADISRISTHVIVVLADDHSVGAPLPLCIGMALLVH